MTGSHRVRNPREARQALAEPGDALDLRAAAELDEHWAALGFYEFGPGELVRPVQLVLTGVEQTRALGARLAADLRAGDLVVLSGPLGAGKTVLAQGIGAGLGVQGPVTSPTFVLARVHRGAVHAVPMVHVDAYRLRATSGPIELEDLDLDEELPRAVTVVEWGEGLVEALSDSRLEIELHRGTGTPQTGTDTRTARVRAYGPRWATVPLP